jgi:uncharacterized protein
MALVFCPTCKKQFDSDASPSMPFCSPRCRQIDLNRWLSEEISMPYREADEGQPPRPDDRDND